MIAWLKSLPIAKAIAIVLAALSFGLAAGAVARRNTKANGLVKRASKKAALGARDSARQANKLTAKADVERQKAKDAAKITEGKLDALAKIDDSATVADLVSGWNTKRLLDN